MRRVTRIIRVGTTVVRARVCEICPQHPAIWPAKVFKLHVAGHADSGPPESAWTNDSRRKHGLNPINRHRGGRPPRAANVESPGLKRESIRRR